MAIRRPDIYQHNNVNLAISDTDFHRGGFRSAVASVSDLYALSGKTGFPSAPGQLKEYSTIVYVSGETKYYVLVDIDNVGNASGWEVFSAGASGTTDIENIGTGIGIYSGTSGTTALLRSIVGSGDTTVSLSGETIVISSTTGSTTLNSGILRFDSDQQTFQPYTAFTSGFTFYTGLTCPENTDRLNLNALLTVTALKLSTGCTALTGYTFQPSEIFWDNEEETISLQLTPDVRQQIGQELYIRAKNATAGLIANGDVVYISGSSLGRPAIAKARASDLDGDIVDEVVGMATEDIPAGQIGYVTTAGIVRFLNTTGFTAGDSVFLSTTVWGGITGVTPTFPDYVIKVGVVTKVDATDGHILVNVSNLSQSQNIAGVEVINPPFTASTRSEVISAVGSGTIYLPASPVVGQKITVIDNDGDASTWNITIDGNGKNINNGTQVVINTDYGSVTLVYIDGPNNADWIATTITPGT